MYTYLWIEEDKIKTYTLISTIYVAQLLNLVDFIAN